MQLHRPFLRLWGAATAVTAAAALVALGGCGSGVGDAGSALQETLRETLRQNGFENPIGSAPATYKGTFSLGAGRFRCTIGTTLDDADAALGYGNGKTTPGLPEWAYCETDDQTAMVGITDSGNETSLNDLQPGSTTFPAGKPRDIDGGDVLVNPKGTLACGSQEGRGVWCIAVKARKGFLVDGSSKGFTRLTHD